jgi:hypothetical protein
MMKALYQTLYPKRYCRSIFSLENKIIHNCNNIPVTIMIQTKNDMEPIAEGVKTQEAENHYRDKSWKDLFNFLPKELYNQTFLCIKLRQSVVLKKDWLKNRQYKQTGHLLTCLLQTTMKEIQPIRGSFISKVGHGFESESDILKYQFFTSKNNYQKATLNCANEYYFLIAVDEIIDTTAYLKKCDEIHKRNEPYHLQESACSHAAYEACVGEKYQQSNGESGLSPQTAAKYILERGLQKNCHDPELIEAIQNYMFESGAFHNAFSKGQEWERKHAQPEPEPIILRGMKK